MPVEQSTHGDWESELRMVSTDVAMLSVTTAKGLHAFTRRNWIRILVGTPLLLLLALASVLLAAGPLLSQAQNTAPTAPAGLTATPGDTQATLTWDNPGDISITGYEYLLQAQVAKLISSEWGPDDEFGYSVAVDGNTIVVGAHKADNSRGAAYVLIKESGAWSQVARLTASDRAGSDNFGISVAVDGDTVVVGAYLDDVNDANNVQVSNAGSAYVFTKPTTGDGWDDATETAKLTASDGMANDHFGRSVAVHGDTVVVGAYRTGDFKGSAYVFTKATDSVWATATETAKLTASDGAGGGANGDHFGYSVAVHGDTVVVGAHKDDASATVTDSGSAYLFTKPSGRWADWDPANDTETAKLTANNGASGDLLGISVAVDGDTVVVGAYGTDNFKGSAYVFTEPEDGWVTATETAKLTASDGAGGGALNGDQFGNSVAVDGDKVVVGSHQDDDKGGNSGSAYAFAKPSGGWVTATETTELTANDGFNGDEFGYSVAVHGDTVVVGAYQDDDKGGNSGSAYVYAVSDWTAIPDSAHNSDPVGTNATSYTVTGLTNGVPYNFMLRAVNAFGASAAIDTVTTPPAQPAGLTATVKSTQVTLAWDEPTDTSITGYEYLLQIAKLTASDGAAGDLFGHSVAVDGDTAVVGAYEDDSGKGAVYVLSKDSSGAWRQVVKLTASDGAAGSEGVAGDIFGWSVAVDGDTVVVGARYDDSAYVFTKPGTGWATATETAKLTASDGVVGDWFGQSVAVDGDTVVVGAGEDDDKGSAYMFTKPGGGWATATETAKLTASDGASRDSFGASVAVDGDTVVVGAPRHGGYGSAYVFTKPNGAWATATQTAKLTPDPGTAGSAAGLAGTFGASVAVDWDTVVDGYTVVVGASGYVGLQGRAYVFTKPGVGWVTTTEAAVLRTSDAKKNQFGYSVAVDGDTLVVGAHTDDTSDTVTDSGSAYLFTKPAAGWATTTETAKLTAADGASDDQFGWSVAVGGGTVVVGAHQDDASATVTNSGSAYVYGVSGWTAIPDSVVGAINATSYTVNDLANDEEHGFWIRARNTVGAGAASDAVTATPINTAPMAVADTATMYEDTVVSIGVVANDTDIDPVDTLSVTAVTTTPSNGTAVVASGTTVTYTPNANFNGADSFDYTLSDGTDTDTGTVNITIIAVNDQPTALDYTPTTEEDTAVQIVVVHNDTDPDIGDTLTISPSTMPSNGEASATSTTTFTYKPKANFNGTDSFDYTLSDGTATDTGTVTITVTAANDAPTAVDDTATTTAGTAVDINVVANDSDVEGDTLTVTSVTTPSNGTAKIKSGSTTTVTYTPGANFNGGSFDYTLSDGTDPDTGTVTVAAVTVRPTTPTGLTASAGLAQVTLNWTDPFDSSIDKYEYSQSDSDSDSELVWTEILNSAYGETNASSYTVTGLTNGITYSFKIRATNNEGTSDATGAVTATSGNAAPTFDDGSNTSRSVEENSLAGTNVGEPVTATDREGDTSTYSLSGSDSFSIDANGQITVASGANPDYETKSTYRVTVEVHDGKDVDGVDDISSSIDDTIEVTIALSDVAEVPSRPGGFTANPGNAQATLRWNNPSDSTITGHQYLSERQVARLTAGDRAANDYFGYSVAVNGDTAVVGAYGDDSSKGAAYVLVRQSGAWSQVAKLTALDRRNNDQFGRSVAVDGGTVAVGAALADGRVVDSGAAYMFTKPDTGWANATETAKLTASDGVGVDLFGFSMAMDGDTVVVGAYWDDDKGDGSGSAYVFSKAAGSGWADATETVKLTAYLGAAGDSFGNSVALDENTMAVGAYQANHVDGNGNTVSDSGSAYVFTRQQGAWSQVAKLTAYDPAANDYFGRSVAVDGNTVVVGADQHDGKGDDSGAAYVFTKPSGIWDDTTETARLTASDAASDDKFGISVAVNGRKALVGARQDDDNGGNSGSAYVFAKPSGGWTTATETAKLTASDGAADDEFGISVAVAGDTVVVGAHQDGGSGSAYVYSVSGWTAIPGSAPGGTNPTSYTVTNLTNDAEYDFRIRAVNAHGESDASDAATAVPMVSAEPTPTATAPTPTATPQRPPPPPRYPRPPPQRPCPPPPPRRPPPPPRRPPPPPRRPLRPPPPTTKIHTRRHQTPPQRW